MKKIFIRLGYDILTNGYCTGSLGKLKEYEVVTQNYTEGEISAKLNFATLTGRDIEMQRI